MTNAEDGTYDLLAFLHAGLDFGDISLGLIIDCVDLIFLEDLKSLPGG